MNGALAVVPAGSPDSPIDMRPNAHICVASSIDWDLQLEDIPRLDGLNAGWPDQKHYFTTRRDKLSKGQKRQKRNWAKALL